MQVGGTLLPNIQGNECHPGNPLLSVFSRLYETQSRSQVSVITCSYPMVAANNHYDRILILWY